MYMRRTDTREPVGLSLIARVSAELFTTTIVKLRSKDQNIKDKGLSPLISASGNLPAGNS